MKAIKVIIIGAGPAGLAAGYNLSTKGFKVKIIEKDDLVGGMSKSLKQDGYIYDLGGHRFYTKNKELLENLNIITENSLKPRDRSSLILWNGKFYDYPLKIGSLVKNLSFILVVNCVWDYLKAVVKSAFSRKKESSFEEWVTNRFGKKLYSIYFGPYTQKVWGMSPKLLSAEWAEKRITILNLWDAFLQLFFKPKTESLTYVKDFYYPDLGIGDLFERIAKRIEEYGGEIITKTTVKDIHLVNNKVYKVDYQSNGTVIEEDCDYLLSTAPVTDLIKMITPKINGVVIQSADKLKFKSLLFVFLQVKKEKLTKCNWLYFPDKDVVFFRIIDFKNWSENMAPEGSTGICCEIGCNYDDEMWNKPDEEIYNKVVESLVRYKLAEKEDITGYFTHRINHAYPIYTIDYKKDLERLINYLSTMSNLYTFGRQGSFNYSTMDHSWEMGCQIANFISNGTNQDYKNRYKLMFHDLGIVKERY